MQDWKTLSSWQAIPCFGLPEKYDYLLYRYSAPYVGSFSGFGHCTESEGPGQRVFQDCSLLPLCGFLVAITAVWSMIFHPSKGPINAVLYYVFHVEDLPNWFGGDLILVTLILFSVWKYMGYYMVIYLAGLQGISAELYEAASLDGA